VTENLQAPGGVHIVLVELQRLSFEQIEDAPEEGFEPSLQFGIGLARLEELVLGVEYIVRFVENPYVRFEAAYRGAFERGEPFAEGESETQFWQSVAARIAPTVLYPYLRETASGVLGKAGFGRITLPIVMAGAMFKPEGLEIPPVQGVEDLRDRPESAG
jgi:hypothetical protein